MTPFSGRYTIAVALLLGLVSIVPLATLAASRRVDECANPEALLDVSSLPRSRLERELPAHAHRKEFVTQWTLGLARPERKGTNEIHFRILRSFDPRFLYQKPTGFVEAGTQVHGYPIEPRTLDVDGQAVPIRLVRAFGLGKTRVVGFLFVYEGRPVASPLRAQLGSAVSQLVGGSTPLTFYIVSQEGARELEDDIVETVEEWLAAAWEHYRQSCIGS